MSEIILISASSFRRFLVILITSFALSTCAAQDAARVEMFYKGLRFYLFDNFVPANDTFTALSDSLVGSPTPSFLKARIASRSNDFATAQLLFSDASKMDRKNPSVALYANINEIYYHYTPDLDKHVCASAVHLGAFLQYLQAYQRIGKLSNLLDCIQSSEYLFYNSSLFKYYLLSLLQRGDSVEYRSRLVESTCFVPYEYDSLLSLLPVPIHSTVTQRLDCDALLSVDISTLTPPEVINGLLSILNCNLPSNKYLASAYELYPFSPDIAILYALGTKNKDLLIETISDLDKSDIFRTYADFLISDFSGAEFFINNSLSSDAHSATVGTCISLMLQSQNNLAAFVRFNSLFKIKP